VVRFHYPVERKVAEAIGLEATRLMAVFPLDHVKLPVDYRTNSVAIVFVVSNDPYAREIRNLRELCIIL
tara:strand:+ start:854 stop:1060 length:207 start_codon:yes stop_codon:yes gene_type:complete